MITAIDTSILLDVFGAPGKHAEASARALRAAIAQGSIVACEVVWAETSAAFDKAEHFQHAAAQLGLKFSSLNQEAAVESGRIWRAYRAGGGKRVHMVPDFVIGAHAQVQCDRLLTRDRRFFRSYFKRLTILDPAA